MKFRVWLDTQVCLQACKTGALNSEHEADKYNWESSLWQAKSIENGKEFLNRQIFVDTIRIPYLLVYSNQPCHWFEDAWLCIRILCCLWPSESTRFSHSHPRWNSSRPLPYKCSCSKHKARVTEELKPNMNMRWNRSRPKLRHLIHWQALYGAITGVCINFREYSKLATNKQKNTLQHLT